MNLITIRNLKNTDTEIIELVVSRLSVVWKVSAEEIEREYILPSFDGGFPYVFIAFEENGEFAGRIILSIEKNCFLEINNQVWISAVFVPQKFRGQGVGRRLIKKAEETAKENGYTNLYLDTTHSAGYYKKIGGWQKLGKDVYKGDPVTIMSKGL